MNYAINLDYVRHLYLQNNAFFFRYVLRTYRTAHGIKIHQIFNGEKKIFIKNVKMILLESQIILIEKIKYDK